MTGNNLKNGHPTIAVLTNMVATPFSEGIIFGAADCARDHDYNLLCFSGSEIAKPARIDMSRDRIFDLIDTDLIDGVILPIGSLSRFISREQQLAFMQRFSDVPVITVNSDFPDYTNVGYCSRQGMENLVEHLVGHHGVRRFVFAGATGNHRATNLKKQYFIEALESHGLCFDESMYITSDLYLNAPIPGLERLFRGARETWPQAIVAGTDKQARNLLKLLGDLGLRVPEDVVVTGSTGSLDGQFTEPPLTSLLEPTYELGWHAAKRVIAAIEGQPVKEDVTVPTSVVIRRSCGCSGRRNNLLLPDATASSRIKPVNFRFDDQVRSDLNQILSSAVPQHKSGISLSISTELTSQLRKDLNSGDTSHLAVFLQRELERSKKTEAFFLWGQLALSLHNNLLKRVGIKGNAGPELAIATTLFRIIQESNEQAGHYRSYEADRYVEILREVGIQLNSEFNVDFICQQLMYGLHISDCFISIFEEANQTDGLASNVMSMRQGRCLAPIQELFPASQLVPSRLEPFNDVYSLIVMPLSFKDEFIGTTVLSIGERKGIIYEGLLTQFSSALKNQIHVRNLQDKESRIRTLAYQDTLTGLANRALLNERLDIMVNSSLSSDRAFMVLFIDLDDFKWINDSMGHDAGDILLKEVARQISQCLCEEDTLARFGGDEFVAILTRTGSQKDAEAVARLIIQALANPLKVLDQQVFISASIGIAGFPDDGQSTEALIKNADKAMYRAKQNGKNRYGFYRHDLEGAPSRTIMIRNLLHTALREENFRLVFQPQIDLETSRVCGVEALIRMSGSGSEVVGPEEFISLAEDIGLIDQIGLWVFKETCRQQKQWVDDGHSIKCALNVSAKQIQNPKMAHEFLSVLRETGADPTMIRIEVTENAVINNDESARNTLLQLVNYGMGIAIDDFGTGYASLSCLQRIPVDTLKVDRSFVKDCTTNDENASIIAAIVMMAKSLKLNIVAEGVETPEHVTFLRDLGCRHMQGYIFSRPIPADQIPDFVRTFESSSAASESVTGA